MWIKPYMSHKGMVHPERLSPDPDMSEHVCTAPATHSDLRRFCYLLYVKGLLEWPYQNCCSIKKWNQVKLCKWVSPAQLLVWYDFPFILSLFTDPALRQTTPQTSCWWSQLSWNKHGLWSNLAHCLHTALQFPSLLFSRIKSVCKRVH